MPSSSKSFLILLLCAFFAGCRDSRSEMEKFLPTGVKLSSRLPLNTPEKVAPTVEQELKKLGAHVKGGKLCDASGKEIKFLVRHGIGTPPSREHFDREQRRMSAEVLKLQEQFTVIELWTFAQ